MKKINKKAHFQIFFFFNFQSFLFFINISKKNSKTSEVNQQSVLNLYIFHHFPKNLERTITSQKYTDRAYKIYYFFSPKQIIFGVGG